MEPPDCFVGNEGEDILLDRIIASRTPGRRIGTELCFSRPYERLLAALDATGPYQGKLLAEFVEHWYEELVGDLLRWREDLMGEPDKRAMRIIEQIAWSYTLYEADDGSYLLAVVVPARDSAWATYEIEHRLSAFEKFLVRHFPGKVKRIAARVLDQEKRSQASRTS